MLTEEYLFHELNGGEPDRECFFAEHTPPEETEEFKKLELRLERNEMFWRFEPFWAILWAAMALAGMILLGT